MRLLFFPPLFYFAVHSQAIAQKTDSLPANYAAALSVYHSSLKPETGLYKGNEYLSYTNTIQDGSPYFDKVPFGKGSVMYHNILYSDVLIAYDVVKEEVVIFDQPRLHLLSLLTEEVNCFVTSGYSFVHLTKDSTGAARLKSGFYEVLYKGKIRILKKEFRALQETITLQNVLTHYVTSTADYYVEKNGVYYPVHNKSSLLSVLNDKGKSLQQFIRKKRLKFRKNKDSDFAQAGAFYDGMIK